MNNRKVQRRVPLRTKALQRAFQFGRLVALEMWREVTKERRRLDRLMDKLVEFEELKAGMRELTEMNLDLVHQVLRLEEVREKRRVSRKGVGGVRAR